ncbi:MAG: ornithine cyclodeaminase family protein [Candidatus Thorarchaeota archaeon]|nr:ornithine cyclodeaminase family protein [Candidatus Thorarchaeota archaeon]
MISAVYFSMSENYNEPKLNTTNSAFQGINQERVDMTKLEILYLSKKDVESVGIGMDIIIEQLETAFKEKTEGRVEMPPKPGIHPCGKDNFIHAMPAYIPALKSAGIKWVSGFPQNQEKGLPYISGLLILNDPETGIPVSVMDCIWITAKRTGAATAIAAKYLARSDSNTLGILGCGVQGRSNVEALAQVFKIEEIHCYDISEDAAKKFKEDIEEQLDVDVRIVDHPKQAVAGCEIVVTAGPILRTPHATIGPGWMDEGSFASLVDFDSYWHPAALKEVSKFCTDDLPQLRHYQGLGYFQNIPEIYAEVGELVKKSKKGRTSENELTMTANLGLAMDDMAVAPLLFEGAKEKGIGTWLAL